MGGLDTTISIAPFNQIIALSQKTINDSFRNLFLSDDTGALSAFDDVATSGNSIMGAALDAPEVVLYPLQTDSQRIYYIMKFTQGTCKLKNTSGSKPVNPQDKNDPNAAVWQADMTGWQFAVTVPILQQDLPQNDPAHKIAAAYAFVNPDNYTTQQLLASLSAATIADIQNDNPFRSYGAKRSDGSYVNNWDKLPASSQKAFLHMMADKYWDYGPDNPATLLGQSLVKTLPNAPGPAATFVANANRYQTYPYIGSNGVWQTPSLVGNGQLNTLLYTQMVQNNTLPDSLFDAGSANKGNFFTSITDAEPSHYGTIGIQRQFWFDQWLLPKLKRMNAAVECHVDDVELQLYCNYDAKSLKTSSGLTPQFSCGTTAANPGDFYNFTGPNLAQIGGVPTATYQWSSNYTTNRKPDWSKAPKDGYTAPGDKQSVDAGWEGIWGTATAEFTTRNSTTLTISQGSNKLALSGTNHVYLHWTVDKVIPNLKETTHYQATWSTNITLQSVSDGGLEIICDDPVCNINSIQESGRFDTFNQFVKAQLNSGWMQLNRVENEIRDGLKGLEKFIFPGHGVYFFKNPRVGHDFVLTTDLGYNGVFMQPEAGGPDRQDDQPVADFNSEKYADKVSFESDKSS